MSDEQEEPIELYPPWKEALKAFAAEGFSHGDLLTKEWFCRAIGIDMPAPDARLTLHELNRFELMLLQQFKPFREKVLEQYQMDLVSDRAGAYLIVSPKDQADRAFRDMTSGIKRELRRGLQRIKNTNTTLLTAEERQRLMDTYARAGALAQSMALRRRLPLDEDEE